MKIEDLLLDMMIVCRSLVFLYDCIRPINEAFLREWN
jgi:hypothetical protein